MSELTLIYVEGAQIAVEESCQSVVERLTSGTVVVVTDAVSGLAWHLNASSIIMWRPMLPEEQQQVLQARAQASGISLPIVDVN